MTTAHNGSNTGDLFLIHRFTDGSSPNDKCNPGCRKDGKSGLPIEVTKNVTGKERQFHAHHTIGSRARDGIKRGKNLVSFDTQSIVDLPFVPRVDPQSVPSLRRRIDDSNSWGLA
jgi:hypothetical protein